MTRMIDTDDVEMVSTEEELEELLDQGEEISGPLMPRSEQQQNNGPNIFRE
jgi:hypothetical protein